MSIELREIVLCDGNRKGFEAMINATKDHGNGVVTDYLDVYNALSYKKFKYYINILD